MQTSDSNAPQGGAVNFDSNLVSTHEVRTINQVESQPAAEVQTLGNIRHVGIAQPQEAAPEPVAEVVIPAYTVDVALDMTIGSGLTFLKGVKELKNVEVERPDGVKKFNFYSPFARVDKDRQTGEGLLRTSFGIIASLANTTIGREFLHPFGTQSEVHAAVEVLANAALAKIQSVLPVPAKTVILEVPMVVSGVEFNRPVTFGELFNVTCWVSSYLDEKSVVTAFTVHFNISINVGIVYDSLEPHVVVRKMETFLGSQLSALGLYSIIECHTNYALASASLVQQDVRDMMEIVLEEYKYGVVSKTGVVAGAYPWVHPTNADQLFSYGCDVILRSPSKALSESDDEV